MAIIEANHVTKEYNLGQIQSLKTTALNQWRRLTGQPVEERARFLDDSCWLSSCMKIAVTHIVVRSGKPVTVRGELVEPLVQCQYGHPRHAASGDRQETRRAS